MTKILVVDDEAVQLRLTSEVAARAGFKTVTADGGKKALEMLRNDPNIGAVVLDLVMPDIDGIGVLETMRREEISVPVIVQTANASLDTVVTAMRYGATDYFVKPVAPERLTISLHNALKLDQLEACVRTERARLQGKLSTSDIVTRSSLMDRVIQLAKKAAKSTIPVLIEGETGVGKELVARAILGTGDRSGKPFVIVNCGAIPANLVESVLFGHVKGAFTGAVSDHVGKFSEANGGTLFLDEVGELPAEAQVKLLRAIQEGEVEPVGSTKIQKVNVRLISATNQRLLNMAKQGSFREDLFYRLNVFPIYVPPLRDRLEDIPPLVEHFITRLGAEAGRRITDISDEAMQMLEKYDWPGNIRQLENAIFRAVVLAEDNKLQPVDFPQILAQTSGRDQALQITSQVPSPTHPVHIDDAPLATRQSAESAIAPIHDRFLSPEGDVKPIVALERDLIAFAIDHYDGHMSKIARTLGIGRSTLYRKLKEYELVSQVEKPAA